MTMVTDDVSAAPEHRPFSDDPGAFDERALLSRSAEAARGEMIESCLAIVDRDLSLGRLDAARDHLRSARELLGQAQEDGDGSHSSDSARAGPAEARPRPAPPVVRLTTAELRVLERLPSCLSLQDIAAELFVGRNTVKTHAASIYRKLFVTRRKDAVDRAKALGLLDR